MICAKRASGRSLQHRWRSVCCTLWGFALLPLYTDLFACTWGNLLFALSICMPMCLGLCPYYYIYSFRLFTISEWGACDLGYRTTDIYRHTIWQAYLIRIGHSVLFFFCFFSSIHARWSLLCYVIYVIFFFYTEWLNKMYVYFTLLDSCGTFLFPYSHLVRYVDVFESIIQEYIF